MQMMSNSLSLFFTDSSDEPRIHPVKVLKMFIVIEFRLVSDIVFLSWVGVVDRDISS